MNARAFLEARWPSRGHYCIAIPITWTDEEGEHSAFKHFIYDTIGGAYKKYETLRDKHDVYFAVNSLKEPLDKKARTHENIAFSRSLFLDLDVGDGPGKYKTRKRAVEALLEFCESISLPVPTLVSSGYGVHCYWSFTEDLTIKQWLHYANLLFRLVMHWGFKADQNCIRDQSRVLRIPGSLNFKDKTSPKPVVVKHESEPIAPEDIWSILVDACEAADLPTDMAQIAVGKAVGSVAGNGNLSGPVEFDGPIPTYAQLLTYCAQVRFIEENGGALPYRHWHMFLGLIRRCSDGREQAHRLSMKNYKNYNAAEVDKKINEQEANGIGPTTCATMSEAANNGLCVDCPIVGRCRSPINAPYVPKVLSVTDLPKAQKHIPGADAYTYVPRSLPTGYKWVTKDADDEETTAASTPIGVGALVEKEESTILVQFLDYMLFPISRQQNYSGNGDQHIWCVHIPHEEPKTFIIDSTAINDPKELSKILFGHGIYIKRSFFTTVQDYMSAYIKRLQRECKPEQKYLHYGWVDENRAFIIGDHKIMPGGKTEPIQCSGGASDLLNRFSLKRSGTVELQIEAMKYFTKHAKPNEQFFILCSLASPLLHMLDNYYGVTVNATGETGGGKTGLLFAAMSLWGNPRKAYMSGVKNEGSTQKARINGLFSMWSLPFALDEISGIEPEEARSFTYAVTQPVSRDKADRVGGLQSTTGTANTSDDDDDFRCNIALTTSNGSLHSRLAEGSTVGAATSARVIEIDFPKLSPAEKVRGDEMMALILRNYGHIGELFIRYVIDNYDAVRAQVKAKAVEIDRVFGVQISERFLSSVAPCVFVASGIVRELGLMDFDEVAIMQWLMVEQLNRTRGIITMEYTTPVAALTDCISETINQMLILNDFHGKMLASPDMPKHQPIRGRYEKPSSTMYITSDAVHSFFTRRKLPRREFLNVLTEMKIITRVKRVTVARGTDFAGGRSICYVINMAHKEMRELEEQVNTETEARLKVVASNTKPKPAPKNAVDPAALRLVQQLEEDDEEEA